jgi:hypothetical protein
MPYSSLIATRIPSGVVLHARFVADLPEKRLWQLATGSEEPDAPWSMLVRQLSCYPGCNQCEVQEEARNKAMFLSGFVWARFETVVKSPPWSLTQIADPRISESEQQRRLQAYLDTPDCDLDDVFSLQLKHLLRSQASTESMLRSLLRVLSERGHATNMGRAHHLKSTQARSRKPRQTHCLSREVLLGRVACLLHGEAPPAAKICAKRFANN